MPCMVFAGQWYSSGTLWSAMSVLAALAVGIPTAVGTYLTCFPGSGSASGCAPWLHYFRTQEGPVMI